MKTELVDVSETRKNLVVEIPRTRSTPRSTRVTTRTASRRAFLASVPARCRPIVPPALQGQIMQDVAPSTCRPRRRGRAGRARRRADRHARHPGPRLHEGQPLTFNATFDVVPAFDPGDLSDDRAAQAARVVVDEDAVNQSLERLRERARPVRAGGRHRRRSRAHGRRRPGAQGTDKEGKPGRRKTSTSRPQHRDRRAANPPGFDEQVIGMSLGRDEIVHDHLPE